MAASNWSALAFTNSKTSSDKRALDVSPKLWLFYPRKPWVDHPGKSIKWFFKPAVPLKIHPPLQAWVLLVFLACPCSCTGPGSLVSLSCDHVRVVDTCTPRGNLGKDGTQAYGFWVYSPIFWANPKNFHLRLIVVEFHHHDIINQSYTNSMI